MLRNFIHLKQGGRTLWKHSSEGLILPNFGEGDRCFVLGDDSQVLEAAIEIEATDGTITYPDITGYTVSLTIRRENGTILSVSGSVVTPLLAEMEFPIDADTIGEGRHRAQIEIIDGSEDTEIHPCMTQDKETDDDLHIVIKAGV